MQGTAVSRNKCKEFSTVYNRGVGNGVLEDYLRPMHRNADADRGEGLLRLQAPKHSDGFLERLKKYVQPSSNVEPRLAPRSDSAHQ